MEKHAGDEVVIGSSLNKIGNFRPKATKACKDLALAHIIRLFKDAQRSKAPLQRTVDAVSGHFVPAAMIPLILSFVACCGVGPAPQFVYAPIVFITIFIIACPCALEMVTSTFLTVGIGKGWKRAGTLSTKRGRARLVRRAVAIHRTRFPQCRRHDDAASCLERLCATIP